MCGFPICDKIHYMRLVWWIFSIFVAGIALGDESCDRGNVIQQVLLDNFRSIPKPGETTEELLNNADAEVALTSSIVTGKEYAPALGVSRTTYNACQKIYAHSKSALEAIGKTAKELMVRRYGESTTKKILAACLTSTAIPVPGLSPVVFAVMFVYGEMYRTLPRKKSGLNLAGAETLPNTFEYNGVTYSFWDVVNRESKGIALQILQCDAIFAD